MELQILHNKFFIVLIDKASGNVAFICQRYYAQVFINELSLNNVNNITRYKKATKPLDKYVASFLKSKFHLVVAEINKNLPHRYWISKLQKNLSKQAL